MIRESDLVETLMLVTVLDRVEAADGVVLISVGRADGSELPEWQPGAHIDLRLRDDLVRQYSLCGDPEDRSRYTVGVLLEPESRGGSKHVHESLHVGETLRISRPRNHFELVDADSYIFIAGGIGITPIASMIRAAERAGKPWQLAYGGRSRQSMAFLDELSPHAERVQVLAKDESARINLPELLAAPAEGTAIYVCGPDRLLDETESICEASWPSGALHLERFTAKVIDNSADTAFEIELVQTGKRVTVAADRTVLETLADEGIHVLSSCGEGTCGTCETPVLEGEVDHRDSVLTKEEQDEQDCMMVCVSRAKCALLKLDV
ncbi:oxidoreductase [Gulosibacter chungangensis]|uniref:Oxidoreductase n=2 Tax=Gulosibacter chungangensis TaxID=979746 RepID=A0A7J5BIQ4_9MICO|nr:oxidoreductase [Gulosibacter chungangensis]